MKEDPNHIEIEILKQIDAYLKGALSNEEINELWVNLLKHPQYLDYLETEAAIKDICLDKLSDKSGGDTKERAEEPSKRWISNGNPGILIGGALAATLALLISLMFLLQEPGTQSASELAINDIPAMQMESPATTRSNEEDNTPLDSLISQGLQAAFDNNISKAKRIYEKIIRQYDSEPSVAMAFLNLGIINYNLGEYTAAIDNFKSALSVPGVTMLVSEKAYWYMGNAYLNVNRWEEARNAVYNAYVEQGVFRKPAKNLLENIDSHLSDDTKP